MEHKKFSDWMKANRWNCSSLAREIGMRPETIRRTVKGVTLPSVKLLRKLNKVSGGAITQNDFGFIN